MRNCLRWPLLALPLIAAACSDTGVEPAAAPRIPSAAVIGASISAIGDTLVTRFTIDPTSTTTFSIGRSHVLSIPAQGVCDLATSSYGPGEWDQPCTPMSSPLVITARSWRNADGLPQVDFSPSLRFNPAAGTVTLYLRMTGRTLPSDASILYCATPFSPCVDEVSTDPSLATHLDGPANFVYRRIKHFSGYNVSSGREFSDSLAY